MANQKQVLRVVMVDDEVPLSLAVRRILAKYDGVLIGDSVGMGKTVSSSLATSSPCASTSGFSQ